jgi:tetratricopeptide (TPR) repeat protein
MPSTAVLTSADLREIRQSVLGAADPLGVAADLAASVQAGRADAGPALTLAAEIAESRSKLDAALRYVDGALEAYAGQDDSEVVAARALRARILFRSGREDEAMAELEPLRPQLTRYPDAAAYLGAALAAGGRNRIAEQWLSEAVQEVLAQRATSADQSREPATAEDAGLLFFLLQQRHRVRHALSLPHDTHDNLAERLETRLASAAAEPADLLFWPRAEFDRVLVQWPALAESYGATWDEHRSRLERAMVQQAGATLLSGTVDGLIAYAGNGDDPAQPTARTGYARELARSAQITWPPERNEACWCGSGNKYKKCCLPRSRG